MTIAPTFSGARQSRVERDSHTQELCEHNKHDFFLYLQTSSKIGLSTFVWALGALYDWRWHWRDSNSLNCVAFKNSRQYATGGSFKQLVSGTFWVTLLFKMHSYLDNRTNARVCRQKMYQCSQKHSKTKGLMMGHGGNVQLWMQLNESV